jgi:ubiquinone/menaquinone biosynthesis C-methylase UbiE
VAANVGQQKGKAVADPKVDTTAAEAYESALVPGVFGPWAQEVVAGSRISPGSTVLDLACGTGVATRYAAGLCLPNGRVIGIDIDSGMVEIAKAATSKLSSVVAFRCAPADDLPLDSASTDVALCLQGLQFFPDRSKAFAELHRVLRPEGKLVATTWSFIENCKGYWAMVSALEARGIDAAPARKPFSLPDPEVLRKHAEQAGFRHVTVRTERRFADFASAEAFVEAVAKGAPSSRHALAKVPQREWPIFLSEVGAALAQWTSDSRLRFPMESNILHASR